jgi:hypothetical protein
MSASRRARGRQSARDVLVDLPLQVIPQLLVELAVGVRATKQRPQSKQQHVEPALESHHRPPKNSKPLAPV